MRSAVLVDAVRTPSGKGKPGGALSATHPVDLFAVVLSELLGRTGLDPVLVEDVLGGCVSQVGEQAVNISRNAVLAAGFPESVPATTIDRQCGSSQQAVHFAAQGVMAGAYDVVIAGGVESMSRLPIGSSFGDADVYGAKVAARYPAGLVAQGISAEIVTARWNFSREELDGFAARSHQLAAHAISSGGFADEIVPVVLPDGSVHTTDETVRPSTTTEGLAMLAASFRTPGNVARFPQLDWHITAGNSSPLTDGASAVLIMEEQTALRHGLRPRARFRSFAVVGDDPVTMLTGPIPATALALKRANLTIEDIDAYEVNEAFAPVPLAWAKEVGADMARLNPRGGAIALGHAMGSSGTRLFTTLLNHLEQTGGSLGLVTMCEGGGMANATIIERC